MFRQASGWLEVIQTADHMTQAIALVLLLMSMLSWYFILSKGWTAWRQRDDESLTRFWRAASIQDGVTGLRATPRGGLFGSLAEAALQATQSAPAANLAANVGRADVLTRVMRNAIHETSRRLEAGLTPLASIGSTAPFIGLFGTVWGIYHALQNIGAGGELVLEQIAGPVGEALIMTAIGLAVAIPAVLAYNAFARRNRLVIAEVDGFARDLLALFAVHDNAANDLPDSANSLGRPV